MKDSWYLGSRRDIFKKVILIEVYLNFLAILAALSKDRNNPFVPVVAKKPNLTPSHW